jgi:two-component system KDP operon response regulator KdpE
MHGKKVLIIDDDTDFLHLAGLLFLKAGAQIFTAQDGLDGLIKLFIHHPDLITLDVKMPGIDGFEVCKRIQEVSNIPIILVTAINDEQGMLRGLEAGADDFLSKPFNPLMLLARAKTILRRNGHLNFQFDSSDRSDGRLRFDVERRNVLIRGIRIQLTPVEFRLLVYLVRNAGKVLTYEHILTSVWGNEHSRNIDYVQVYISSLRRKIEENSKDPRYILTVPGVGYIFERDVLISNEETTV